MNTEKKKDAPATAVLTNIDYAATTTVPTSHVREYAGLKVTQLAVLTTLISEQAGGHDIQLSDNDMWALTTMAAEMALLTKGLVSAIVYSPAVGVKGGA